MQVVDVLGAEIEAVAHPLLDLRQRAVRSIGLRGQRILATHGVETPDEFPVGVPRLGRGDFLDAIAIPEASGSAECSKAALGGNASPGEDEQAVMWREAHDFNETHAGSASFPYRVP